jgi:integrase
MPTLRRLSDGTHQADLRSIGLGRYRLGKNQRKAEQKLRDILAEHELASRGRRLAPLLTGAVLRFALEEKKRKALAKGRDPATVLRTGKQHGANLERILGAELDFNHPSTSVETVGTDYFDARIQEQTPWNTPIKPHTILKELGTLRQGLHRAKKAKLFEDEPSYVIPDALRHGDVYKPRERWLTEADYAAVWALATPYRRPWLDIILETGADLGELRKIKREHVDAFRGAHGYLHIPGTKAASRKRDVPLTEKARRAIDERLRVAEGDYLFHPVWTSSNFKRSMLKWCARTGVEPFIAKDLRRTFASRCCQLGIPEMVVAKLLGHTDSKLVRRVYGKLSTDTYDQAISRLSAVPYDCQDNVTDLVKHRENAGT